MRRHTNAILLVSCLLLLFCGNTARGGDGIEVTIANDSTDDIVVTVYDMSTNLGRIVLTGARMTGFTSVPVSVEADYSGKAKLSWTATSTDPDFPQCGHASVVVSNADTVKVHADSDCTY
jgi:predicted small secreted protein